MKSKFRVSRVLVLTLSAAMLTGFLLGAGAGTARAASEPSANDEGGPAQQAQAPEAHSRHVKRTGKTRNKTRRTQAREKETEGTEAPNRFKTDTVIRSQYQLDGKPLEVDPD